MLSEKLPHMGVQPCCFFPPIPTPTRTPNPHPHQAGGWCACALSLAESRPLALFLEVTLPGAASSWICRNTFHCEVWVGTCQGELASRLLLVPGAKRPGDTPLRTRSSLPAESAT